ncbi:hypothetical protein GCM10020219_078730 [Nonomuraea dietziae]
MLPSPFVSDEKGVISGNADYLTDGRVTATDPKQVVTLTLNPKGRWSNGEAITWQDYAAQWKALNGANPDFRVASTTGYQDIESVAKGKDDYEVVITFKNDFGDWQSLFAPLYPKATNTSPETFNTSWLNKIPVTAGPFRFQGFDQTAKTITIVRDDAWWGEKAKLDQVIYRSMESDSLVGAFTNGEIDVFDIGPSAPDYARAKSTQGSLVRQGGRPRLPAHHDERRERRPVGRQRAQGHHHGDQQAGHRPVRPAGPRLAHHAAEQPLLHEHPGGLPGTTRGRSGPTTRRRPRPALDAAGWKLSGQTRMKDGKPLNLKFVMPSGLQLTKSEGELIQNMLAQIGVQVTLQAVPSDDFFTKHIIPATTT